MPIPSALGNQIERELADSPRYRIHPAGHTEYLLRYQTVNGVPFAVGRTAASAVRVWISADDRVRLALEADGFRCMLSPPEPPEKGKRATGRNSNLEQIAEFKNEPLYWARIRTAGEALAVAAKLP